MADEYAEFWSDFEKETGEKVEARSEGKWYRVPGERAVPEGLLILTDKSFRFKYVPDTLRPLMGACTSPEREDRAEFNVARSDIVSVRVPKRGFFARLIRRAFPRCSIVARGERTYEFAADPSSGLIAALERDWPNIEKHGPSVKQNGGPSRSKKPI